MAKVKQLLYEDIYKQNFSFGKNWQDFLKKLNGEKIEQAKNHLATFMGSESVIKDKLIIDFGCGSGLMSLCFVLLGAKKVISVDIDDSSIECAKFLRKQHGVPEDVWVIQKGSVLDTEFIKALGKFDIVYSWGVIHHTGDMWAGLENISELVGNNGFLYLAIYNHCKATLEGTSELWVTLKRIYSGNKLLRLFIKPIYTIYLILGLTVSGYNPFKYIRNYSKESFRGMDFFTDIEDWLGGYPYEYASYQEIIDYYKAKDYEFLNGKEVRSIGCNEFLFVKNDTD